MMTKFNNLDPNKKRIIVVMLGLLGLGMIVSLFSDEAPQERRTRETNIRHILTDKDTRDVGIESLSASVKSVTQENTMLKKEIEALNERLEKANNSLVHNSQSSEAIMREINRIKADLERTQKQQQEQNDAIKGRAGTPPAANQAIIQLEKNESLDTSNPEEFFRNAPINEPLFGAAEPASRNNKEEKKGIRIQTIRAAKPEEPAEEVVDDSIFVPSGSILTGVLINGLDAPTSMQSRRDPFPATIRLQKEAILPNHFTADVRECFMLVGGYGDLSSERAYLRGERISCIREDGGAIEVELDAYVVGEDGKAGVRGRVVSKQGQIIAKSLMAGFLGGMSEALDVDPVPVINTTPTGEVQFQKGFSEELLQGATVKGASRALDRIAQFYIDMAENIFPVIEVDAGRQVDIILVHGAKLKLANVK